MLGENLVMRPQTKYSRIERERRFLLDGFPNLIEISGFRRITDRYIDETRLRLRRQSEQDGSTIFKLSQKIPAPAPGAQQGFITTMYLDESEFRVLAQLPARQVRKTRYSVPPFGIDVFEDELQGLVLAEIEFNSVSDAEALAVPSFVVREVSADNRFTGGRLARTSRDELQVWLRDDGILI